MMLTYGKVIKLGPGHYRIVHPDVPSGKTATGTPCHWCGNPRTKRSAGKLCSRCRRIVSRRRAVGEE